MAKLVETNVLSVSAEKDFLHHVDEIKKIGVQYSGLAASLAFHLAYIESKKYHTTVKDASGNYYKSIGKFAEDNWGLKKATVSEAISTFNRFGDMATGEIKPEYKRYNFTALIKMRQYCDEDIKACVLVPEAMSVSRIVDKLAKFSSEKEEKKEIMSKWNGYISVMSEEDKKAMAKELKKEVGSPEPVITDLDIAEARLVSIILDKYSRPSDEQTNEKATDVHETDKPQETDKPKEIDKPQDNNASKLIKAFVLDKADFAKVADLLARMTGVDTSEAVQFTIKIQ